MEIVQIVKKENINGLFDEIKEEKDKKKQNSFIEEKDENEEFSHEEKKIMEINKLNMLFS